MTTLFTNIKFLAGVHAPRTALRGAELATLPVIEDAFLLVEDDRIAAFGKMYELELHVPNPPPAVEDMHGRMLMPCWCDSHTHLVFAGSRENEFVAKLQGKTYAEIAAAGGGILNSAKKLNETSEDKLYDDALERLKAIARTGTGAVEIKSGYGLSLEGELKMLRVIKRLRENSDLIIQSTLLAAHAYPAEYRDDHEGWLKLVMDELIPAAAKERLADYIDVFCETGFFTPEEMKRVCTAAADYGLKPKLHVNQLNSIGGIEAGIELDAVSLDHLETLTDDEIKLLGAYQGSSTLLPTAAYFLRLPFQPARALIDANAAVTIASDFNPGSSPSGNMNFVASLSCIQMKMLPEEVINAGTINGAFAMDCATEAGSIAVGKKANLIFTKPIPSLAYIFYSFGADHIEKVMIGGRWQ